MRKKRQLKTPNPGMAQSPSGPFIRNQQTGPTNPTSNVDTSVVLRRERRLFSRGKSAVNGERETAQILGVREPEIRYLLQRPLHPVSMLRSHGPMAERRPMGDAARRRCASCRGRVRFVEWLHHLRERKEHSFNTCGETTSVQSWKRRPWELLLPTHYYGRRRQTSDNEKILLG